MALPIDPIVFDILTWLFILPGAALLIIGGIGMITMPDVFARMHPAGVIDTLGCELILVGLMFQAGLTIVTIKLALILAFIFFTSPTATHALARACLNSGVTPKVDEEKSAALSRGGRP